MLAACSVLSILWRSNIKGGTLIKKAIGAQHKSGIAYGHNWPIFETWRMVNADGMPENKIGLLYGTIGSGPFTQTDMPFMLIGIITRWITLIRMVRRNPDMIFHETGTLQDTGLLMGKGQYIASRHQLVTNWLTYDI
jgi:hypothetical protein